VSNYRPDKWMLVEITGTDPHYRIFGTWYEGNPYNPDAWRLNSGITGVEETENKFIFKGYSGSTYECDKDSYGVTTYGQGMLKSWSRQTEHFNPLEMPDNITEINWRI
tara:strand:- start:404 stop:727 length:324 start_codon:yes stop_codon:yes gene_type:complete